MKLLTKTWFAYSVLLYFAWTFVLDTFVTPPCSSTEKASKIVAHAHRANIATFVFITITVFMLIIWSIVRYKVIRKTTTLGQVGLLEALVSPTSSERTESAEETVTKFITAFFSCLMRFCMLIALLSLVTLECSRTSTLLIGGITIIETLVTIAFFYFSAQSNAETGLI